MNVSTKLQGPQVAVEKPLVLSPEQATGIMIEALTVMAQQAIVMAQQATMTTECLDLIAEYFQKKGIQEGLFDEKDFTEEKEEKSE